jgi:hypothetical protein
MTTHAPRIRQQFAYLSKDRARAICLISDQPKFRRTFETLAGHGLRRIFRKYG